MGGADQVAVVEQRAELLPHARVVEFEGEPAMLHAWHEVADDEVDTRREQPRGRPGDRRMSGWCHRIFRRSREHGRKLLRPFPGWLVINLGEKVRPIRHRVDGSLASLAEWLPIQGNFLASIFLPHA